MAVCVLDFYQTKGFVSPVAALIIPRGDVPGPQHRELQRFWITDETGYQVGHVYVKHKVLIQLTGMRRLPLPLYCWRTDWMNSLSEVTECLRVECAKHGVIIKVPTNTGNDSVDNQMRLFEVNDTCFQCERNLWAFTAERIHRCQEVCLTCGIRYRFEKVGTSATYSDMDETADVKDGRAHRSLRWHDKIVTKENSRWEDYTAWVDELTLLRGMGRVYLNNAIQLRSL